MKLRTTIFAAVFALIMLCSCSREGFEESLNRKDDPKDNAASSAQFNEADAEEFIFDLSTKDIQDGNCLYYCDMPIAASPKAADAADKIAAAMEKVISEIADETADGRGFEEFTLYNAVTRNDGKTFSVVFEAELYPVDGDSEEYVIGFIFNAQTGERMQLKELIKPEALVTLILDEQSSKVSGRKEELVARKRAYLSDCGEKQLTGRLTDSYKKDIPIDASYYFDGDDLVSAFSAVKEFGEAVEVSIVL